ncbi:thymidine phosphorylase [Roseimaritima ulvae]|uniref:thymidine phosphorylase n=1 Tax=Roseimaritima ulvae TaxID=980254 RepID=A0A5B9QI50_9BACT|nr:thymidine phosphorylase [Roseimaritima ulvae]QEG38544.1 Pyrimidine-nucleoside phosphorylase [Roseimaritima ulvae]
MLTTEIIAKTRDRAPLSREQIDYLIGGFSRGEIPDYQMAAWAMAVRIQGLSAEATAHLTAAMLASGDRLPRRDGPPRVDKHSTGGLGDKVSLVLAPLLACCDVQVPMISGRGLGLSGGTLDKLESIPGLRVELNPDEAQTVLDAAGCFIIAASERIAPADRRLYALRDVTGCVESIPLITASILSKKLAASLDALVMDVKVGSGAFMQTLPEAQALARSLVDTGKLSGLPMRALLSDMDQPLGRAVGNANEVREAFDVLQGRGPQDVRQLTIELGSELLPMVGVSEDRQAAANRLNAALNSGRGWETFQNMVAAQGGDCSAALPSLPAVPIAAPRDGCLSAVDSQELGRCIVELGGGRRQMNDRIDHAVGIDIEVKIGQNVRRGQPLCWLSARQSDAISPTRLQACFRLTDESVQPRPLILDRQ